MFNIIGKYLTLLFVLLMLANTLISQEYSDQYQKSLDFYNQKQYHDSIAILENIEAKNTYDLPSLILLIDNYIKTENYIRAKDLIVKLKRYHPQSVLPLERELEISLIENDEKASLSSISNIVRLDNKNYYAKYSEGLLAQKKGYLDRSIKLYEQSLKLTNYTPEAIFALSYLYQNKNQKQRAIDILTKNQSINSDNEESYYHLANIYYLNNDYIAASNQVERALYLYSNYTKALILDANIKAMAGLYDEAVAVINKIDDRDIGIDKYYIIGNIYDKQNLYDKASENYGRYLKDNVDNEIVRYSYEKSLLNSTTNINRDRVLASSYYSDTAKKYTRSGDPIRSLLYNKKMLRLNPTNVEARINISDIYKRMGYVEKYVEELGIIKDLMPDNKAINYRYENDSRSLMRNIISKKWGISQYDILDSGFSVAISPYITDINGLYSLSDISVEQSLSDALNQYNKFTTVDSYTNYNIRQGQFLDMLDRDNIDFYIAGTFNDIGNSISIDINLIDSKSRNIIKTIHSITYGKEKLINSSINIAKSINESIPFYATIIKVDNSSIYINAGKWQGITNKQRFAIYNGSPVYDYNTKSINTNNVEMIGFANVLEVDENVSLLKLEDGSLMRYINDGQFLIPYIEETKMVQ